MNKNSYKLYHNPHFLQYSLQPDLNRLVIPQQSVASIRVDPNSQRPPLEQVYAASQHLDRTPWFCGQHALLHVRSTSVGDVIQSPDGQFHVVESFGFQPLPQTQPATTSGLVRAAYEKLCLASEYHFQDKHPAEAALLLLAQAVERLNEASGQAETEKWD